MIHMHWPTTLPVPAGRRSGGARAVTVAAIATAAALTLSCGDSSTEPPPQPPAPVATSLTVTPASAELAALGETVQFAAEVRDQNGQAMAGAPVTWSSSDAAVATVGAAGLVTAVSNGSATVTAMSGEAAGAAEITVEQAVAGVEVSPSGATLVSLGDTVRLVAGAADANGHPVADAEFDWTTSDASVATVGAAGLVTAVSNGSATVTATSGEAAGTAEITVEQAVAEVEVSPSGATLVSLGDTVRLTAGASDANGHPVADAEFDWTTSDASVATVGAAGLVTAVSNGSATVTATSGEAAGATEITVEQAVAGVEVSPSGATLVSLGDTVRLVAGAADANGRPVAGAEFDWATSDASVATVDAGGLVTAAGNGAATVTASSGEASAAVQITVEQAVAGVEVFPSADTLLFGDTLRIIALAIDANGHEFVDADFRWSSSDTLVASVNSAGLVKAVGWGKADVSARVGGVGAEARITVESAASVAFVENSVSLDEGETLVVGLRYRVRQLETPLRVRVAVTEDGAEATDYALSQTRFEIPAGEQADGTLSLTIRAQADDAFAEGEERLSLSLAVPDGSGTEVGPALAVEIGDAPVSPSRGITLSGTPPEPVEAVGGLSYIQARDRLRTTLTSEWRSSSQGVSMRWVGPYGERREWIPHHPNEQYAEQARPHPPQPDFHIESWHVRSRNSVVTHVMDVSWPADSRLQLRFGGEVGVACAADGCTMTDGPSATSGRWPGMDGQSPQAIPDPGEAWPPHGLAAHPWNTPQAVGAPGSWLTTVPAAPFSTPYSAGGGHAHGSAAGGRYLLYDNRWHPSVWPPGDTLVFYLSSANWPENAGMTPEEVKDLLNQMLAEWSDIPTADILWRVDGPLNIEPGRDGRNIFFLDPGSAHGGRSGGSWTDQINGVWGIVEADHSLGRPEEAVSFTRSQYDRSPWPYIANEMGMHPLGHTLGLGHAASFPGARSCPGPTYAVDTCGPVNGDYGYWRRVSGAWALDPIMSYGITSIMSWTENGRTLRLDDRIGASLLRPRPGWLATTGTITGSVRTEDGRSVPHIHIWAVRPSTTGRMDGVGAFADRNGSFEIQGLPPGDWILIAHPDLDWLANPWFYYERQGELLDEMLLYPVRTRAGQTTGGVQITMARGR